MIDPKWLELLVCPVSGGTLAAYGETHLHCEASDLCYPIVDGIPVLLAEEAVPRIELETPS
ncbi:MAG: Trm112 family protein [Gammaproteobacteria bacterium AqS3]|nr:Trm112 family protein [Gammaproteobacteria bacterium AqS3]